MRINGSTNNPNWTYKLEVNEISYDINSNSSVVRAEVYLGRATSRSYLGGRWSGSITIDGQVQNASGTIPYPTYINGGEWLHLYSKDFTIGHNSDGSKNINISSAFSSSDFTPSSANASGNMQLITIPRASTITSTSAYIGETSQLTITKRNSNFNHSIRYVFGELSGYINEDGTTSESEVIISATSIGLPIPTTWYAQTPNSATKEGTLYITTYNNGLKIGDTQTCPLIIRVNPDTNKPFITSTVRDLTLTSLTNDPYSLINGFSQVDISWEARARHSATISDLRINGNKFPSSGRVLLNPFKDAIIFEVTDSRGFKITEYADYNFIDYFKPNITFNAERKEPTSGLINLIFEGTWFNNTFGNKGFQNNLSISWEYKETYSEEWITGGNLVLGQDYIVDGNKVHSGTGSTPSKIEIGGELSYEKAWDFRIIISDTLLDKFTSQQEKLATYISKGIPILWWNETSVSVEGDLYVKGKSYKEGIVFETTLEEDSTEIIVNDLDMVKDGGEYEFTLFHYDNGGGIDCSIQFNDISTGYHNLTKTSFGYLTDSGTLNLVSNYNQNVERIYGHTNSSPVREYPARMDGKFYMINNSFKNTIGYELDNKLVIGGFQKYTNLSGVSSIEITNLTSLRFYKLADTFRAGTKLIIRKKV